MRIVARHALFERVVPGGIDLRKAGRPGGIVGMASNAELPQPGQVGFGVSRVLCMGRGRTVTCFAGEIPVIPPGLDGGLLVATSADVGSGKAGGLRHLPIDTGPVIELLVLQGRWENGADDQDECNEKEEDNRDSHKCIRKAV